MMRLPLVVGFVAVALLGDPIASLAQSAAQAHAREEAPSGGSSQERALRAFEALVQTVAGVAAGKNPLETAEKLVPQTDPNYQAWSQHLRDQHREWAQTTAPTPGTLGDRPSRRRTQWEHAREQNANTRDGGATDFVARLSDDTDHSAAEIRDRINFSETSGPISGRNEDGCFGYGNEEAPYSGAARYEHLRNVFSSSSCDDPLALNHGSTTTACTYR